MTLSACLRCDQLEADNVTLGEWIERLIEVLADVEQTWKSNDADEAEWQHVMADVNAVLHGRPALSVPSPETPTDALHIPPKETG